MISSEKDSKGVMIKNWRVKICSHMLKELLNKKLFVRSFGRAIPVRSGSSGRAWRFYSSSIQVMEDYYHCVLAYPIFAFKTSVT